MAENDSSRSEAIERSLRAHFEAGLPASVRRASHVQLLNVIPSHWFSAAASECARMYVAGYFYGAISVSQAYVEALAKFLLTECCRERSPKGQVDQLWDRLRDRGVASQVVATAAREIFNDRNDYHHLNSNVETDHRALEDRAREVMEGIYLIDTAFFSYTFDNGAIVPKDSRFWPVHENDPERILVFLRSL